MRFEELTVWQESILLSTDIYKALKGCRDYSLKDQMQRSGVSVPSNIAEGFEHQTDKLYIKHLYCAKASCGELRTQLYIASNQQIIASTMCTDLIKRAERISGMLQNMITKKKKSMTRRIQL